jgi:hypothetical protein
MMLDEDKAFEQKIKGQMSNGTCPCQMTDLNPQKTSLHSVTCRICGKTFKTNSQDDICFSCKKKS